MKKNKVSFFIIGNPRSGTTLLRLMLTSNKKIVVPPESSFAIWLFKKYSKWNVNYSSSSKLNNFLEDLFNSKKFENWKLNKGALKKLIIKNEPKNYSKLIGLIYFAYAKKFKKNFMLCGDKNNYHLAKIKNLNRIFPNSKFIHLVRDGRNVACSYIKLSKKNLKSKYAPNLPSKIKDIAKEWNNNILTINQSFKKIKRHNIYEIKFEDLVSNPEENLKQLCIFLNIPYDSNMLYYYKLTEKEGLEPKEFIKWKKKNLSPLLVYEIDRYKKELNSKEINLFTTLAKKSLKKYNYL